MKQLLEYTPYIVAGAGIWALANGILHDIFVLIKFHTKYDRDLLRLLMDGHVMITCGLALLLSYKGVGEHGSLAIAVSILACSSLLVYCAMIFPFLKSMATIAINLFTLALLIILAVKK